MGLVQRMRRRTAARSWARGVRGQVGLPRSSTASTTASGRQLWSFNYTTVSAWVKRIAATNARETIVCYKEAADCGFVLDLQRRRHEPVPALLCEGAAGERARAAWQSVTSEDTLAVERRVHLAGTYDGSKNRLYQNGVLPEGGSCPGTSSTRGTDKITIGSRSAAYLGNWALVSSGAIDEVQILRAGPDEGQIWRTLYHYRAPWSSRGNPPGSQWTLTLPARIC